MAENQNSLKSFTSGEFLMMLSQEPVIDDSTFSEPAYILQLTRTVEDGQHPLLALPIRSSLKSAHDTLTAVIVLATARDQFIYRNSGFMRFAVDETIAIASSSVVRHGWASVWINGIHYATPFVDDWGFAALYADGNARPSLGELREIGRPPDQLPPILFTRRVSSSIHMKESWAPWAGGWPFSGTFGNLAALLDPFTHQGVDNIKELIHLLWVDAGAYSSGAEIACIKELRIHSHGNESEIRMGDDSITTGNFDANGVARAGTPVDALITALKKLMCKPGKIIFDACNAAKGTLLQNISKNLGSDITVNGFSGTGYPATEGDTNYVNGVKV